LVKSLFFIDAVIVIIIHDFKVLFATETFAMGVNMPTKTVVFDSTDKYDGNSIRNLLPTEYIQMAGRAGRRGHDETGTVIILCKKRVPSEKDLRYMALGAPQNLVSKFKVTYLMVLHLKRLSEAISIDEMMRRSFKEMKTMSNENKNKHELEKIINLIEQSSVPVKHEKDLETFYDLVRDYFNLWQDLRPHMLEAKKATKALVEGRLLLISYKHHCNKLGIFLGFQNKTKILYKVFILTSANEEEVAKANSINIKSDTWYDILNLIKKNFYKSNENPTHEILTVPATSIIEVINKVIDINCKFICADWEKRQIPRFK
jgi:antiviral helicase SKI2